MVFGKPPCEFAIVRIEALPAVRTAEIDRCLPAPLDLAY
jgi:hypothetical protein